MSHTVTKPTPLPQPPMDYNPQYMRQLLRVLELQADLVESARHTDNMAARRYALLVG